MLQIPPDQLSPAVLDALIEEFVTRHGTDLTDAAAKSAQVRAQLLSGRAVISYDDETETANIVLKDAKPEAAPPTPPPHVRHRDEPSTRSHDEPTVQRPRDDRGSNEGPRIVYDEPEPPDMTE